MTPFLTILLQAAPTVADDIRDIRGPIGEPAPWWAGLEAWGIAAVGAMALALVLVLTWRALRRPKNACQVALGRIERAERHAAALDGKAFAHEVSEAVRTYTEARFSVHAPQRTTEELLEELADAASSPLSSHRPMLAAFLARCDQAKFGGASLAPADMKALADSARDFVRASWRERDARSPSPPAVEATS